MKTTLEKLREENAGYAFGSNGITEADLRKVNEIIDRIENTRTEEPQELDVVEFTDEYSRPIAYSTVATSDLIVALYNQYGDLRLVYENLHYDEDAKKVVSEYLKRGIYEINIR